MNETLDLLIKRLNGLTPRVAFVLGSGLGGIVETIDDAIEIPYHELPGFPVSRVTGHAAKIVAGNLSGVPVIMLSGRTHYYEHGDAGAMRPVLETLKGIGVQTLILTNAAGSVDEKIAPGSVMLIDDHINFSGSNPLIGESSDARFVPMTQAYDLQLSEAIVVAAQQCDVDLKRGVYMWFSGPSFETPAEIRAAQIWGASAVGMSTVPEVILARFLGLRVGACSIITNYGAGMAGGDPSHSETKDMAPIGGKKLMKIIQTLVANHAF